VKNSLLLLVSICSIWLLSGCGGSSTPPPPVATHFSVTAATSTATAGMPFTITVTALDAAGQMVVTYSGTVHFTSSNGHAVQPASGPLTSGTGTFSVALNTSGDQTITVTDTASLTGTSSPITVRAAVATQFSMTPATSTPTAGTPFNITVTAMDASSNVVTSYSGSVHLSSSDAQFVPPSDSGLPNGTGTFQVTLKTAGAQSITATDTVTPSITGGSSLNVNAGAATHLSVSAPTAATAGIQFSFTVTPLDAYSNVANTYTGMVHFSSNDIQAALPANATFVNGTGTFSVTLKTIENTTLTATDTATASITGSSSPITVVTNAPTHFALVTPGNTMTRASFNVTVSVLDAANNVSTGYSGTVHFTSTDTQAILPANSTLTNGTKNFSATIETAGNQTITATDTATASLTGASSPVVVTAAAALTITSGAPPSGVFGVNYGPVTTEYFKCYFRPPYGYSCTPCSGSTGCSALPLCYRHRTASPCVEKRQVFVAFTFAATGGVLPYAWSASGLPPGLSVDSSNGKLTGTPSSPGSYDVSVTAADSGTPQVTTPSSTYTIVISDPPPPVINATPAPPSGAVNLPYSFTFTAVSPAPTLTWRISIGTLPAGLTLNPDGVLSGTPTAAGTSSITLIAQDSFKQDSAPQDFTIQIFAHGFKVTGSMAAPRIAHTSTLLNSGKVLVAGGTDANGAPLATAELYDPTTQTFSTTGSMGAARAHFAAALLPNGKVLVTGGLDASGNPLATAELYDPTAGTFSATKSNMTIARASHTATLLNTGKVLVAGWDNAFTELFDPSTETFAATGSMMAARVSHTATLLNSGKVLVTGGIGGVGGAATVLAEAELYDPTSGSFSRTLGSMSTARQWHTASLLADGKVLVTGGMVDNAGKATATAELFDPTTQMFTGTTGSMATARDFQTATVLKDGTVLVTGGDDGTGPLATAEVYDPAAGTFSPTGSMGATRESHTATLLNDGTALVTGGAGSGPATAELYP
jgi:hypothetical protein